MSAVKHRYFGGLDFKVVYLLCKTVCIGGRDSYFLNLGVWGCSWFLLPNIVMGRLFIVSKNLI